jgi:hypothetical protein
LRRACGHAISPVFAFSQATDHSNHKGQISTGGLLGSSDRSLADFFQIGMDPNHLVNIAYADNHAGRLLRTLRCKGRPLPASPSLASAQAPPTKLPVAAT